MNSKRSYLDTVNAGRQRRPHTTLEQLNRSLETLEQRLERSREEAAAYGEPRYGHARPFGEPRLQETSRRDEQRPTQPPRRPGASVEQSYQAIARDIDRMRGQEDGVAAVSKIAGELRGLRDELRQQMTVGVHREFQALRQDIERAYRSGPSAKGSAELGLEFERLSGAIQNLAEKSDDKSVNLLRLELEQVKSALETLAREESVRGLDRRWDEFDRRWSAFENRFGDGNRSGRADPEIAALTERLEQIGSAVANLPESLSLRSLEEKVRTLAGAVDHFVSHQGSHNDTFGLIDERLDEISRAIVASTVAVQSNTFDPAPFERIERRIDSLAQQIEEVAADRPGSDMADRLGRLSDRVDDLAARTGLPEQAMERLGMQIAEIARRIDQTPAMPQADALFQGIEQRFDALSQMLERRQGDALEHGNMLFRDLERRLEEVAERLDRRAPDAAFESSGIMEAIDARFTALAKRLETRTSDAGGQAAIRALENRLEDISSRLDSSAAQVAAVDPDLIRSLEAQVAGLSAHLSQPGTPLPVFEDIAPHIERIEKSLTSSRDSILEAAREAAENAVRTLAGAGPESTAVSGLANDLKTLEGLTRRSDERNAKTFEAIHDTLLKIVDRLGSLEGGEPEEPAAPARGKIAVREAPTLDIGEPLPLADDAGRTAPDTAPAPRSPAEAAAEAARAALGSGADKAEQGGHRKSMLGGLTRALKLRRAAEQPEAAASAADAPTIDIDEPLEPKLINRPLEPGSGAPDLSAIMKRVRDERGQHAKPGEGDAAKSDFIAAARRAAQAAAAEAEALKRQSTLAGPVKALRIGDLIKARRKPILMAAAAIMLALAGLQLGKAFLADPQQTAASEPAPIVSESQVAAAADSRPATASMAMTEAPAADAGDPTPADTAVTGNEPPVRVIGQDSAPAPDHAGTAVAAAGPADVEAAPAVDDMGAAEVAAKANDSAADTAPAAAAVLPATDDQPAAIASASKETTGAVAPAASTADAAIAVPDSINPPALREAAAKGDPKALFEIGSRYAEARGGVKEDMAEAAKWYQKAADLGFAPAEYRIGNFYEKGIGVARDIAKSKTWYQLAAEQGNASAMHNLAVLYAMAADGTTDNQSATHWFQEAADLGVKDSQFNLGILAAKGVGMKQDLEESYKWFALVAKTGDKDAAAKRDEIANALRPEQLERARGAVELWKAKPLDTAANTVDIPDAWQEAPTVTASIDMKKAVQNIQKILNKNGYDAGGTDGVMGDRTKKAIMAFQSDNGMEATGTVDEKLVKALLARK